MVALSSLFSTVVMAVLLVAIVVAIARQGSPRGAWIASHRRYVPGVASGEGSVRALEADGLADSVEVWIGAFLALVFGFGIAALVLVGWLKLGVAASLGGVVIGMFGLLLVLYLGVGVYLAARSRGHPYSMAAGQAVTVLAMVGLLAITVKLFLA